MSEECGPTPTSASEFHEPLARALLTKAWNVARSPFRLPHPNALEGVQGVCDQVCGAHCAAIGRLCRSLKMLAPPQRGETGRALGSSTAEPRAVRFCRPSSLAFVRRPARRQPRRRSRGLRRGPCCGSLRPCDQRVRLQRRSALMAAGVRASVTPLGARRRGPLPTKLALASPGATGRARPAATGAPECAEGKQQHEGKMIVLRLQVTRTRLR